MKKLNILVLFAVLWGGRSTKLLLLFSGSLPAMFLIWFFFEASFLLIQRKFFQNLFSNFRKIYVPSLWIFEPVKLFKAWNRDIG